MQLNIKPKTFFVVCVELNSELIPLKMSTFRESQHSDNLCYEFKLNEYEKATKFEKPSEFLNIPESGKKSLNLFLKNNNLSIQDLKIIQITEKDPIQQEYNPSIQDFF